MKGLGLAIVLCCACGSELAADPAEPSRSVTQRGAQDIGEFGRVVDAGGVPALDMLDELGFFAEHALDLPPADCGDRICAHPMLAVAPRFDDGNWTMAFVALNSTPDADAPPSPRKHVLVITSGSGEAARISDWHRVLAPLAEQLGPDDFVSVLASGAPARLLAAGLRPDRLAAALRFPPNTGNVGEGLYAALAGALDLAQEPRFADHVQTVVLFTEGVVPQRELSGGKLEVSSIADFEALARRFAQQQLPVTSIGLAHPGYKRLIPVMLSQVTGGNYYVSTDTDDAAEAMAVEAQTSFTPLARDLRLTLRAAPGYTIGGVFGASSAEISDDQATLHSQILFESGRRGGFFVQLVADEPGEQTEADAFELELSYEDATSGARATSAFTLRTPLGVGNSPEPTAPFFSDVPRAKPFMVLNMYLALRTMLRLHAAHGCGGARSVHDKISQSYDYWQQMYDDSDIASDFELLQRLARNIERHCDQARYPAPADYLGSFQL